MLLQKITPLRIYKASAGSGKTFTLAVEYIALLAINPMEYPNILAVTFTNKATAEMKQRILSTLFGIGNGLSESNKYVEPILNKAKSMICMPIYQKEPYLSIIQHLDETMLRQRAKEALSNIIHDYSRFHIETIDSFFQSIVHEIANELELPTNLKVELDTTEVLATAVDDIIDNLQENSDEFRTIISFIHEKIRQNHSWQIDKTVKNFAENIFKENYLIHGEKVRKIITNHQVITQYREMIEANVVHWKQKLSDMGKQLVSVSEQLGLNEKDNGKKTLQFLELIRDYDIRNTKEKAILFTDSRKQYITNVDAWFVKKSKNRTTLEPHIVHILMPLLEETFNIYQTYQSHLHTTIAIRQHILALTLLNEISKKVKLLNEGNSRFLLSETAYFLRNMIHEQDIPFIYEKTGTVIKHIMIDEFQDTSTLQWDDFKPLILNSLDIGGSCLIVGDVKQSIYRFRNSDWRILNNIEKDPELKNRISHIPAKYNFRSSKHVVTFNNTLFRNATNILKSQCPELDTAYDNLIQEAKKTQKAGFVKVENIDYHTIDKNNTPNPWSRDISQDYNEAILQRIQTSIKDLLDNGVTPNDITILVRENKDIPLICDYFNEHKNIVNVKVVSNDAFRLDASSAINIIIYALRALAEPNDKLHLATLAYYYQKSLSVQSTSNKEKPEDIFLCDTIDEIDLYLPHLFSGQSRKDLRFKALTEVTEDLYQIFQLKQQKGQDAHFFFFHDLIVQFCADNRTDLDTFLEAWDEKLCKKTIPNGASDGVKIMTMHKSKGLEFHSVIIPANFKFNPRNSEVMWCIPQALPYNQMPLLPINVNKATDDSIFANDRKEEELRTLVDNINIFYVAFTRAKNNLIILTGNKLSDNKNTNTEHINSTQSLLIQAMPDYMTINDIEGIITTYQYGSIVPTLPEKEEEQTNVMECTYTPLSASFISYPTQAEFCQSYGSDMFITAESTNPKTQQHTNRIRLISVGNLYHNIFEQIHTINDVPHTIQLLKSKGCFDTLLNAKETEKNITQLINSVSSTYPEWFSPEWTVLNERSILFLDSNKQLQVKRPDRVIVKNNTAIIIDYKTAQGVVHQNPDGSFTFPSENETQINTYKKCLKDLGYTHIRAYLWYIMDKIIVPV